MTALVLRAPDRLACRNWIAHHSKSFYLSSLLLPRAVREASWSLYAFCRRADDTVDEGDASIPRVAFLRARLRDVYAGAPADDPIDRSFAAVVQSYEIPEALPAALLDGMEMDARDTRYETDDDLLLYCFRVAATVGLMMAKVMGVATERAYFRAADLGIAMQLTNIARDIGEDARRDRVYLPTSLLHAHGATRDDVLTARHVTPAIAASVSALLGRAELHYRAADVGVRMLPRACRLAIRSSRLIYAAIGADVARNGYDSITRRAHTSGAQKLALIARALPVLLSPSSTRDVSGPADAALAPLLRSVGLPA
jgi:phytoene synthase